MIYKNRAFAFPEVNIITCTLNGTVFLYLRDLYANAAMSHEFFRRRRVRGGKLTSKEMRPGAPVSSRIDRVHQPRTPEKAPIVSLIKFS